LRLELSARRPCMEHLADRNASAGELAAGCIDVGDNQVETLRRAGGGGSHACAELDRTPRTGRRELQNPEAIIETEISVEPPPQPPVELLRAVDIRDGDDDCFELHVNFRETCISVVLTTGFIRQVCHLLSSYILTRIESQVVFRYSGLENLFNSV